MSEIIERLLSGAGPCASPVVLLSATLTAQKRKRLVEALRRRDGNGRRRVSADHAGARREGDGDPRGRLRKAGRVPI